MKKEVKKLENTKREITIEVSADIVKNKFEDVFSRIAKDAKVAGFRPGNAPRDILEKNFSGRAHQLVTEELVPETYNQAVKEEGLDVIELPSISDVKLDRESLSFKATVEISPEIKLENYKGLKVNYKKIEVTPEEIKRSLDSLKESRKINTIDDAFAKGLGYPDLSELEEALKRQIFIQKENQQRQRVEREIIDGVSKGLDFKLPVSMVNRQLQDLVRQAKIDLALKGYPKEKIDEKEKELAQKLEPEAREQVRVYLVMAAVAKKENIPVDDHMPAHVMELLLREANWQESS